MLKTFPELLCQTGTPTGSGSGKRPSESIVCIGNEATYRLFGEIIDTLAPLFSAPWFHVGADEIDCPVVPLAKRSWDRCAVCGRVMRARGYRRVHDLFYYALRRLHAMLARHGKRMMMWNDYIDIARPVDLPRDILIHFWRIADKRWPIGPRRGCSLARFLKAGFEAVNSHYPEAYVDVMMQDQRLASWRADARPPVPVALRSKILGGEMCAWGAREHYPYTLPQAIPFFGDRLWNASPVRDLPAYARALARHLFGPQAPAALADLFEALGSILPPMTRDGVRVFPPEKAPLPGAASWPPYRHAALRCALRSALADPRVRNHAALEEYRRSLSAS